MTTRNTLLDKSLLSDKVDEEVLVPEYIVLTTSTPVDQIIDVVRRYPERVIYVGPERSRTSSLVSKSGGFVAATLDEAIDYVKKCKRINSYDSYS